MDAYLGELLKVHYALQQATKVWRRCEKLSPEVEELKKKAILLNHKRYYENIPLYHDWVNSNHCDINADIDTIINDLVLTGEIFKNYDKQWIQNNDFVSLTEWLSRIYIKRISSDTMHSVENLSAWRDSLRKLGVNINYSSGSQGRLSIIPRDAMTLRALSINPQYYADLSWNIDENGKKKPFFCLIAGFRGDAMGIQSSAQGLARGALKTHYMFSEVLDADMIRGKKKATISIESEILQSISFIQNAIKENIAILIFGTPFLVARLCRAIQNMHLSLRLPENSLVVTGGGWKTFLGEKLPKKDFLTLLYDTLNITSANYTDAYSSVEINCTLSSCSENKYHIPPLLEPVVYDSSLYGEIGREGFGVIGLFDPFAMSYPGFLITGDQGHLVHGVCKCGLDGWSITGEIMRATKEEIKGCGGVSHYLVS